MGAPDMVSDQMVVPARLLGVLIEEFRLVRER
jgi:hypothetical protein